MMTTRYTLAAVFTMVLATAGAADARVQGRGQERGRQEAKPARSQTQQSPQRQKAQAQQGQRPQKAQPQQGQRAQKGQPQQAPGQGARKANQGGQDARAQPRGQGQDARPGQSGSARGRGAANAARPARLVSKPVRLERLPARFRPLSSSGNPGQRAAAVALARGRDYDGDLPIDFVVAGDRVRLMNGRDELLLDLSDADARDLGYWDVRRLDPRGVDENAPAFCRSGAGHPVWGREWCMDKGFGLGASDDEWLWGRHRPDDIVFRREDDRLSLERGGIIDVLGDIVFNRLALHAVTLGLVDPLAGRWIGEPAGPRVMQLDSGGRPVAELVDWDRDGRVDIMYVASR